MKLLNRLARSRKHEKTIRDLFPDGYLYSGDRPVYSHPLYLLAFSNRAGSNLLAEYLRSTTVFDGFREQLNHDVVSRLSARLEAKSFPDYLKNVSQKYGSKNAIYGFKASWSQIMMLLRCRIPQMYSGIRIIHIVRADPLAQAVSYSIAYQTKRWTSVHKGEPGVTPEFDFDDIARRLEGVLFSAEAVPLISSLFGIPRVRIQYEDLAANPVGTMRKIGEFSGHDFSAWVPNKPVLSRQAGTLNEAFAARFSEAARARLIS
jgi:trehalose 2-sulfotransferase